MVSSPWRMTMLVVAALMMVVFSGLAHGGVSKAQIFTDDFNGPKPQGSNVTYIQTPRSCEYRLEFAPPALARPIKEVLGDRGAPQRVLTGPDCRVPGTTIPFFVVPKDADIRKFEEQTTYYWAKVARDYAEQRIWITPPGFPGKVSLAVDGVQPNVLTLGSFSNACWPRGADEKVEGCMRAWPHEGPKIHVKTTKATPDLVVHEYGHYAAGYVFGHMDPAGFSVPAVAGDCAKLAFQEAAADMFKILVLHNARYGNIAGRTGGTAQWATVLASNNCSNVTEYVIREPLEQAFRQSLLGSNEDGKITVNWRLNPLNSAQANNPDLANRTMANAFVYGLGMNRGHRVDELVTTMLAWLDKNEPLRAGQIRKIFENHGLAKQLGQSCREHSECASLRCDNRPGAGCVAPDGGAAGGEFCTTHQQCRSGFCTIAAGRISGACTATSKKLGEVCATHAECASLRCDNRPGAGCVAPDGGAASGQFCTTHQQCRSGFCTVASGRISGACR